MVHLNSQKFPICEDVREMHQNMFLAGQQANRDMWNYL